MALIQIDGKPLEKLIEVVSGAVGTLYRPRQIRKEADAEAYRILTVERAKTQASIETRELEQDFIDRTNQRVLEREIRRQKNIELLVAESAQILQAESTVSDEAVDPDWTTRFFNIIQDVSQEELRILWAKILAGEVAQPKTFSLRTLELLKNLTKQEAMIFTDLAKFHFADDLNAFVIQSNIEEFVEFKNLLLLDEVGLLSRHAIRMSYTATEFSIRNGSHVINLRTKNGVTFLDVLPFTKEGRELLKLVSFESDSRYLKKTADHLVLTGASAHSSIVNAQK